MKNLFLQVVPGFSRNIKVLLVQRTKLTIMNEQDQLVLYMDASTNDIVGVLMQIQEGMENCVSSSHMPYRIKHLNGE